MDVSTLLEVDYVSRICQKSPGNKFCFDFYWVFPHTILCYDNDITERSEHESTASAWKEESRLGLLVIFPRADSIFSATE